MGFDWIERCLSSTNTKLQHREKAKDDFHGGHGYVELEDGMDGEAMGI